MQSKFELHTSFCRFDISSCLELHITYTFTSFATVGAFTSACTLTTATVGAFTSACTITTAAVGAFTSACTITTAAVGAFTSACTLTTAAGTTENFRIHRSSRMILTWALALAAAPHHVSRAGLLALPVLLMQPSLCVLKSLHSEKLSSP